MTDAQLAALFAQRTGTDEALLRREMLGEGYTPVARAIELGLVYCIEGEAIVHRGRRYAWPDTVDYRRPAG